MLPIVAISVAHMRASTVAWSLMRFLETSQRKIPWIVVDNFWPLEERETQHWQLWKAAEIVGASVIVPPEGKNIGGHGGFNFGLSAIPSNSDYVLSYDPDSNPTTPGWLETMAEVIFADSTLGGLSLMPVWLKNKDWEIEVIAGRKVAFFRKPVMYNVTCFRRSALKETGGLQAQSEFYGNVERSMFAEFTRLGLRHGYLFDFVEDPCPIPHPKKYTDWKGLHSSGLYLKNFDQYVKEHP